jgi:hypothetical protein
MSLIIHWPQATYLALNLLGLGIYLTRHGEPRGDKYNFWSMTVTFVFVLWLLYRGGFFGGAA